MNSNLKTRNFLFKIYQNRYLALIARFRDLLHYKFFAKNLASANLFTKSYYFIQLH